VGWVLIVNPFASGVSESRIAAVTAALPAGTSVQLTRRAGAATDLARAADGAADAIVVFAGDGTYNEVVNGISGRTPVGFVPGGGTSVLPRALGLPRDPARAAAKIAERRTRRIALGVANGRRFAFNAGVGLDAELVRAVDAMGRRSDGRRPGDSAFARAALRLLASRRGRLEPTVEIEGLGRAAFVMIANCSPYTYAGSRALPVAPEATFEGGLDLVAPVRVTGAGLPALVWDLARGRASSRADVLTAHDADRIVVRCDAPTPLQVDGEDLGDTCEVVLEAERDALEVLC
jgi:diacylglycerol kinase family enzyme